MTTFCVSFVRKVDFEAFVGAMSGEPIDVETFCFAADAMVDLAQFFTLIASDLAQESGGSDER